MRRKAAIRHEDNKGRPSGQNFPFNFSWGRPDDRPSNNHLLTRELDHLPAELRWRELMGRVEATIFAAAAPVDRGPAEAPAYALCALC
jgi:hypothetical protein